MKRQVVFSMEKGKAELIGELGLLLFALIILISSGMLPVAIIPTAKRFK
jgi:hypothetical protein